MWVSWEDEVDQNNWRRTVKEQLAKRFQVNLLTPGNGRLKGVCITSSRLLGGLLVQRRTSVSQIRGSIPRQVAAV